jgi:hypothetical protein
MLPVAHVGLGVLRDSKPWVLGELVALEIGLAQVEKYTQIPLVLGTLESHNDKQVVVNPYVLGTEVGIPSCAGLEKNPSFPQVLE